MDVHKKIAAAAAFAVALQAAPMTVSAASPVTAEYADSYGEIISGADYNIMVRLSGKHITAASDGNVQQWSKKDSDTQTWRIESVGKGLCKIVQAMLDAVNALVLCPVVHKEPLDLVHKGDQLNVKHKDGNSYDSL